MFEARSFARASSTVRASYQPWDLEPQTMSQMHLARYVACSQLRLCICRDCTIRADCVPHCRISIGICTLFFVLTRRPVRLTECITPSANCCITCSLDRPTVGHLEILSIQFTCASAFESASR
jgi:hypothetical protein